ncbi:MAG: ATP-binding protein [Pseudomonadota bacterium]
MTSVFNFGFFKPSIRRRIAVVLLAACALVWCAVYLQGTYITRQAETGVYDRELVVLASAVADVVKQSPDPTLLPVAMSGLEAFVDAENRQAGVPHGFRLFYVWDANGTLVLARNGADTSRKQRFGPVGFSDQSLEGKGLRVYGLWSADARYFIEAIQTVQSRRSYFHGIMFSWESANILFIGVLCLLPALLLVQSGLRPLTVLAKELAGRRPGDLSPIQSPSQYLEIAPLVDEFNATLARLGALLERERSFLADAAHELRTPLAVVTAQVDTLILAQDPAAREEAAQRLRRGLTRASRLVNQLLALARLEAKLEVETTEVDVADVIRDCLAAHGQAAGLRGMELSYSGAEHIRLTLAPQAIESILDNLIGNAVRYGSDGGTVEVRASLAQDGLRVEVVDDGPGIGPESQGKLFERFHRGNHQNVYGSGLGLAIVASAAKQIGAQVVTTQGLHGRGVGFAIKIVVYQ